MSQVQTEAHALAAEYLERFWDGSIPVDPIVIAQKLGIRVRHALLPDDVAGAITKRKGADPAIIVERRDHPNRQRFTVAHELGHYVRKTQKGEEHVAFIEKRDQLASMGTDPEEIFANEFAAALLMPEKILRKQFRTYNRFSHGSPDLLPLASAFRVSEDAMRYRLIRLGLVQDAPR